MWWKVPGEKSEQVLLTMLFRNCSLMLIFFLWRLTGQDNVQDVFQRIYIPSGSRAISKTLSGHSYRQWCLIQKIQTIFERPEGELLSRVFYCDPMASWQKGRLEKES